MHLLKSNMVKVAQLVEHRVVVPRVMGSIPIFHPNLRSYELRLADAGTVINSFKQSLKSKSESCPSKLAKPEGLDKRRMGSFFSTMYYVYLIKSSSYHNKIYVGYTTDLKRRLETHNAGGSTYTAPYKPWKLVTYLGFDNMEKAKLFEVYLKTSSGKAFALKRLC